MNLSEIVSAIKSTREQKSALEKIEKALLTQLKPLVDPVFDANPGSQVLPVDSLALSRVPGVTRSISADLLLERGVSPEIVAAATKTTNYYKYLIA